MGGRFAEAGPGAAGILDHVIRRRIEGVTTSRDYEDVESFRTQLGALCKDRALNVNASSQRDKDGREQEVVFFPTLCSLAKPFRKLSQRIISVNFQLRPPGLSTPNPKYHAEW